MSNVPPGWYVDPANNTFVRWFDGMNWTAHAQPRQPLPPQQPGHPQRPPLPPNSHQAVQTEQRAAHRQPLQGPARGATQAGVGDTPNFAREQTTATEAGAGETLNDAFRRARPEGTSSAPKIGLLNGKRRATELQGELDSLRDWMRETGVDDAYKAEQVKREAIEQAEELERNHRARAMELKNQLDAAQRSLEQVRSTLAAEETRLVNIRANAELQDLGIFDFTHPAESSADLSAELDRVRSQYKSMVRTNSATTTVTGMTFDNSSSKGERFLKNMSKLLLRAYNAEAENAVKAAKAGNLDSCVKRLNKAREQVERNGKMIELQIMPEYHRLRISEIELANRHLRAKEREKELDRERRAQLREERKAEAEFKAKRADLLKEQRHYQNLLDSLRARNDSEGLNRVLEQLHEVEQSIADVEYRAANTRAGYVYVISNVGSFGENVVKIGMTRRLEPMDRVRELGDASVPFGFDVHAMFFSQDAVGVETMLHQKFSTSRINQINLRREYFSVTPQQVLDALRDEKVEIIEFTLDAPAEQYRQSIEMAKMRLESPSVREPRH